MAGITFDTGALIALERRRPRMRRVLYAAELSQTKVTVPVAVVAEWWRSARQNRADVLDAVDVEPMELELGKLAGEAIARLPGATTIDAIVMASAARRGDVVYTSDFDDLDALRRVFPSVRVLGV